MNIVEGVNRYQEWGVSFIPLLYNAMGLNPISNAHTYQKRRPDKKEVDSWIGSEWRYNPKDGIAVIPGEVSLKFVILSYEGQAGLDRFEELRQRWQADRAVDLLAETPVVKTVAGFDVWVRTKLHTQTQALDGLIVRSDGCMVTAPPSIHPGGLTYEFVNPNVTEILEITSLEDIGIELAKKSVEYQPAKEPLHLSDTGNAQRLVARHGRNLRYCYERNKWLCWNGKVWEWDSGATIESLSADVARMIYEEAANETDSKKREELVRHGQQSESAGRRRLAIQMAKSEPGVPVKVDELDADNFLLNFANGAATVKVAESLGSAVSSSQHQNGLSLRQHKREDLATKIMPVAYDPQAKCPTWDAFLDRVMAGNQPLVSFLQRAVGYSLTGTTKEQCYFIMYGTGSNGKTTFANTILAMMGDYAMQTPMETLLVKKNPGVRNDVARLNGARFVLAAEMESQGQLAEALVKQLTGGDKMSTRFLYQEYFEFVPTSKLWLGVNYKPVIKGADYATWRRIRLIPFKVTIPKAQQDLDFPEKLLHELPGIMAWAVRGCLDWLQNGLEAPPEVSKATQAYRDEMDILKDFIADCCEVGESQQVSLKVLFEVYSTWCETNGRDALGKSSFGKAMKERGIDQDRGQGGSRYWKGIGIK